MALKAILADYQDRADLEQEQNRIEHARQGKQATLKQENGKCDRLRQDLADCRSADRQRDQRS